jgi:hypothetical protein
MTTLLLINHWNTTSTKIIAMSYSKATTKQLQNDWELEVQDENTLEC